MGGLYGILLESGAMCFFLLSLNQSPFLKEGPQKGKGILYRPRNIYQQGELDKGETCKEILQVQTEAGRLVRHTQPIYNLDVIISEKFVNFEPRILCHLLREICAKIPALCSIVC
jgi:hypothetical protein